MLYHSLLDIIKTVILEIAKCIDFWLSCKYLVDNISNSVKDERLLHKFIGLKLL